MQWQQALLERVRLAIPSGGAVRPYGSVLTPADLGRWSDLDIELDITADVEAEALFGGAPWAWQSTVDAGLQSVRLVLADGRRVDVVTRGSVIRLPAEPSDNHARFDLALAATRFGRRAGAIGLHLTLGVVREALVYSMLVADRRGGTAHHRFGSETDADAARALTVLSGEPSPSLTTQVAAFYAERRTTADKEYRPDWSGLAAIVATSTDSRPSAADLSAR